jgi:hypothetical protein
MFGQPPFPGFPGSRMGLQPWMPPWQRNIFNDTLPGHYGILGYSGPRDTIRWRICAGIGTYRSIP